MYDFCVVGAGIVGLATAMTLLQENPGASLVLMEKESAVAVHQTGHNSGVIHSGIYYQPGSLKARFSKQGAILTKEFCQDNGLAFKELGKLLVATSAPELARMDTLEERAAVHGVRVQRLDSHGLRSLEPNVEGIAALLVPTTSVVDYRQVSARMSAIVAHLGGEILLGTQVNAIEEGVFSVSLTTVDGRRISCGQLVVCGGLQSDRLARMAGLSTDARIVPFRGEYYRLSESRKDLVHHLIYPIPDPSLPFLGVHLTPTLDGEVTVGPNAVLGLSREGYPKFSISTRDMAECFGFPGFWAMAAGNVGVGLKEMKNSLLRHGYLKECRRFAPSIRREDLIPHAAGIRAQAVSRTGALIHDFVLLETPRMLHVINAPSPAATASIPIARELSSRLRRSRAAAR
ncbi:L-2-hydroxyglutarate oxidase [Sinomonas soli]